MRARRFVRKSVIRWTRRAALLAALGAVGSALAQSPVAKQGSCPSGYHTSGDYCLRN